MTTPPTTLLRHSTSNVRRRARSNDITVSPELQKLLQLPGNEAARAKFEKVSPFAVLAGPDADVVCAEEERSEAAGRASRSGKRAEMLVIDAYHADAFKRGIARMEKVATPFARIGPAPHGYKPNAFVAVYSGKPWVDCHGFTLRGPTRSILEEVKVVTTMRADGSFDRFNVKRVRQNQCDALDDAQRGGHIAIVTLVFGEGLAARVYTAPWSWVKGRVSVDETEVRAEGFGVVPKTYLNAYVLDDRRSE